MKRIGLIAVALAIVGVLAGCQASFKGDQGGAHYIGRPGFRLEFTTGGFGLYVGPDGNMTTTGTAGVSAGTVDLAELIERVIAVVDARERLAGAAAAAEGGPSPPGDGG